MDHVYFMMLHSDVRVSGLPWNENKIRHLRKTGEMASGKKCRGKTGDITSRRDFACLVSNNFQSTLHSIWLDSQHSVYATGWMCCDLSPLRGSISWKSLNEWLLGLFLTSGWTQRHQWIAVWWINFCFVHADWLPSIGCDKWVDIVLLGGMCERFESFKASINLVLGKLSEETNQACSISDR